MFHAQKFFLSGEAENTLILDPLYQGKLHKAETIELTFKELGCCVTSQANRCQSKSEGEMQTNES